MGGTGPALSRFLMVLWSAALAALAATTTLVSARHLLPLVIPVLILSAIGLERFSVSSAGACRDRNRRWDGTGRGAWG